LPQYLQTLDGSEMTEIAVDPSERKLRPPQIEQQENTYNLPQSPQLTSPDIPVDRGPEVVATTLAPQLGSDASHLSKGNFDMRKLSVINERDIPLLIYADLRGKKNKVWGRIYESVLNLNVSINGRGRRDIIRMEGVSKGGLPDIQPELERPGWLSRNVTDRNWRDRMKDEMV
jgi:hypothetical protein